MNGTTDHEAAVVEAFVVKTKRERIVTLLANPRQPPWLGS